MLGPEGQTHGHVAQERQSTEGCGTFSPDIHVAGIGACGFSRKKTDALPSGHQTAAIVVSERLQKDRIDNGEDRRARTDG